MLELALEKEIHSYRDIDETTWPAVKLKRMGYEFIDESSEVDEELTIPLAKQLCFRKFYIKFHDNEKFFLIDI